VAIPARLEQDVDDLAVLVDGPPEVLTLTTNRHEEFVEMPRVADRPARCRIRRAYARPKVSHQCRMDSYETVMPRFTLSVSDVEDLLAQALRPSGVLNIVACTPSAHTVPRTKSTKSRQAARRS